MRILFLFSILFIAVAIAQNASADPASTADPANSGATADTATAGASADTAATSDTATPATSDTATAGASADTAATAATSDTGSAAATSDAATSASTDTAGAGATADTGSAAATSDSAASATPATSAATCPKWLKTCGQACYDESAYCCINGWLSAGSCDKNYCPSWLKRCGDACFSEKDYTCQNNILTPTGSTGASASPAPTTGATNTGASAAPSTSKPAVNPAPAPAPAPAPSTGTPATPATKATSSPTSKATSTTKATSTPTSKSTTKAATTKATSSPTNGTTKNPQQTSQVDADPNSFPTQTADLRLINNCKTTLWFEARYGGQGGPIPGQTKTATRATPGSYVDYTVPATGLPGSRFWAKFGCDSNGRDCEIGDQMQYWPNPPGGCPSGGCTPPVDSLFEATWGCKPGSSCYKANPTTWFDTSQVDGWTIPYKLTTVGDTSKCDCIGTKCGFKGVDASRLSLDRCPSSEDLSYNGQFPTITAGGKTVSLKSVDLRMIDSQKRVFGCMSPCKRLNWSPPYGLGQGEGKGAAMWMCCPTPSPNNCSPSKGCVLPDVCRAGPIEKTKFVAAVHDMAPGVYSYSYDDGVGLHACPAGVTKYTMTFCPKGSSEYPLQL